MRGRALRRHHNSRIRAQIIRAAKERMRGWRYRYRYDGKVDRRAEFILQCIKWGGRRKWRCDCSWCESNRRHGTHIRDAQMAADLHIWQNILPTEHELIPIVDTTQNEDDEMITIDTLENEINSRIIDTESIVFAMDTASDLVDMIEGVYCPSSDNDHRSGEVIFGLHGLEYTLFVRSTVQGFWAELRADVQVDEELAESGFYGANS